MKTPDMINRHCKSSALLTAIVALIAMLGPLNWPSVSAEEPRSLAAGAPALARVSRYGKTLRRAGFRSGYDVSRVRSSNSGSLRHDACGGLPA